MSINAQQRQEIKRYLTAFDFSGLFTDATVGWDWPEVGQKLKVPFDGSFLALDTVAEKRGVKILRVPPDPKGEILSSDQRKKLEKAVTPLATEHVLIFTDAPKTKQVWLWTSRIPGKPISYRELIWEKGKANELLLQKLSSISFTINEEESLDITGVVERLRDALDRDKVTKKFYEQFETQKDAFRMFIKGISDGGLWDWYTSLMLNRLMFCYFLQRKGFLDGDLDYLSNRLERVREEFGKGKFHSFYKTFLRRLFHEGLGLPKTERAEELRNLIGDVPYLNGGIFEEHKIERDHPGLHIPDEAFAKVFNFLDQFDWHLDDRPIAKGNEINPEILGYVFERYTNQKEMGAYYTKEDITDYIAKNCIVPFLLDATGDKLGDASWNLLRDDPDRYIYPAVGHGIFCDYPTNTKRDTPLPLPDYIERGIDTAKRDLRKRRARWNESASSELGLPTEIWRETVARREQCEELQRRLRSGKVRSVNELITLNLNIRQFAQDVVESAAPDLLLALFKAIRKVSVLDPTCGSGAFLFAALNILEPLYRASLDRMRALLGDWDARGDKSHPNYRKEFATVLDQAARHPNENYFIFKSIIVHNLYGVDIMEEAVEICKLRLFLKLAAQLEPGQEIEPLPDIDFNIRAGNTLVGYASRDEVRRCMTQFGDGQMRLGVEDELQSYSRFEEAAENVDKAFQLFQQMQDEFGMNAAELREQKRVLSQRLQTLRDQLDRFLAVDYDNRNLSNEIRFAKWRSSHLPFHWLVEFYGILSAGGFDVIIGNPPYVEYKDVRGTYEVQDFTTFSCGDLYAFTVERAFQVARNGGCIGLIVPISIFGVDGFASLQTLSREQLSELWVSCFSNRPSQLFNGAQKRITILIGRRGVAADAAIHTTRYLRWNRDEFDTLFPTRVTYAPVHPNFSVFPTSLEKLGAPVDTRAFAKLSSRANILSHSVSKGSPHHVYYTRKFGYFLAFLDFVPAVREIRTGKQIAPSELKDICTTSQANSLTVIAALSSSTFFWFWNVLSDCRNLNRRDILAFPLNPKKLPAKLAAELSALGSTYLVGLRKSSYEMEKSGLKLQTFRYADSKPNIDEIDTVLAKHYGFTEEELDFIINYDIKYRMGPSGGLEADADE